jgi:predicted nucleic acid-binding protein
VKDDDTFLACALASGAGTIVSGDKHLLGISGYRGIEVLRQVRWVIRAATSQRGSASLRDAGR